VRGRLARSARIVSGDRREGVGNLTERAWGGNIFARVREVGMIKRIEKFSSEKQLISFGEFELFEQAEVPRLNARTVKQPGRTSPEHSRCRPRKHGRVNQETRGGVQVVICCGRQTGSLGSLRKRDCWGPPNRHLLALRERT
jgi:hypothetical protein